MAREPAGPGVPPGHRTSGAVSAGPAGDEPAGAHGTQPGPPVAPRRRRRAVGPLGAAPSQDGGLRLLAEPDGAATVDDDAAARDEDLRRDVPPHHGD